MKETKSARALSPRGNGPEPPSSHNQLSHNRLLIVLVCRVQANSIPAAFWTLVLVLLPPHRHLAEQIRSEATRDAHSGATAPTENPAVLVRTLTVVKELVLRT